MESKIIRLKQLVQEIEDLQDCLGLQFEQEVLLSSLQKELNQIIKEL